MTEINFDRVTKVFEFNNDLVKHIATLDTAAIVAVASLLDRFTVASSSKWMVQMGLAGFGISLIGVVLHQVTLLAMNMNLLSQNAKWVEMPNGNDESISRHVKPFIRGYKVSFLFLMTGFFVGLTMLIFFAIENLN